MVGQFAAAPQGRLAVHEARLFPVGQDDPETRHPTVLHDLGHPLNALAKPLRSLVPGDGAGGAYPLSPAQEEVLDVVRRATALRPAPVEQARRKTRTRWWSR